MARAGIPTSSMCGPRSRAATGLRPVLPGPVLDAVGDVLQRRGGAGNLPVEDLRKGGDGHWGEREVGALADVEAPRSGLEIVLIVGQACEVLRAGAVDPVVLERGAGTVL